jgi:ABC-type sugar transport system substrate-binding protein
LKVIEPEKPLEEAIWAAWLDIEDELQCRVPFNPMSNVAASPAAATLFAGVPLVNIPTNLPQQLLQQVLQQIVQQVNVVNVAPIDYTLIQAAMESARKACKFVTRGKIFATRGADLKISVNMVATSSQWEATQIANP